MDNQQPSLSPDLIEELCRHYREAERSREVDFDRCIVRLAQQFMKAESFAWDNDKD